MEGLIWSAIYWAPAVILAVSALVFAFSIGRLSASRVQFQVHAPDARAWVGIASFVLVLLVLGMMWADRSLLQDEFFKVIATALVVSAWLQGPVGWAYQATKSGGDLADRNAKLVEDQAAGGGGPKRVTIDQRGGPAVPVREVDTEGGGQ